ncbi:MAG: HD domain-containing protein [Synergistales bacterium]|nr:HD domain-containing protein [Synergistales bacterium]
MVTIAEIRQLAEGETFKGLFAVQSILQRKDRNGNPFWEISVMDPSGTLDAKIWGNSTWMDAGGGRENAAEFDPTAEGCAQRLTGTTIGGKGKVGTFKGKPQYTLNAVYLLNQEEYPAHAFVQKSPVPYEELHERFDSLRRSAPEEMRSFLDFVFSGSLWDRFRVLPAAVTHHHAYVHGLLEHTVMVTESALAVAQRYERSGIPVDPGVVIAGGLLHDLGKIETYELVPTPEVTLRGAVIDHVALGYAAFSRLAGEYGLEERTATHLGHILLSHHGQKEFGSPILPATPEALIVAAADELDFKLFCWDEQIQPLNADQEISGFHFATQRRFWKWRQEEA